MSRAVHLHYGERYESKYKTMLHISGAPSETRFMRSERHLLKSFAITLRRPFYFWGCRLSFVFILLAIAYW